MEKNDLYYINLLERFDSLPYKLKLETFNEEFDIIKVREAHHIADKLEGGHIFTTDFDVTPKSKEETGIFNEYIYNRIDDIITLTRSENFYGFHTLNVKFQELIESKDVSIFNIESLKDNLKKRLAKPTALRSKVLSSECFIIEKFIGSLEGKITYEPIKKTYDGLIEGKEIDFSAYDFETGLEFFIGIRIAETLAKYSRYIEAMSLEENKENLQTIENERLKKISKIADFLKEKRYIDNESISDFKHLFTRNYIPGNRMIIWKGKNVRELIRLFDESIRRLVLVLDESEDMFDIILRSFKKNPLKKRGEREIFTRKDLETEKSKDSYDYDSDMLNFFKSL